MLFLFQEIEFWILPPPCSTYISLSPRITKDTLSMSMFLFLELSEKVPCGGKGTSEQPSRPNHWKEMVSGGAVGGREVSQWAALCRFQGELVHILTGFQPHNNVAREKINATWCFLPWFQRMFSIPEDLSTRKIVRWLWNEQTEYWVSFPWKLVSGGLSQGYLMHWRSEPFLIFNYFATL